MELTYRGQAYEASSPQVEAVMTGENATFLGRSYARKRFNVVTRQRSEELIYRGVRYTR